MKKNVAILISQLTGGGAERVASHLSTYLPKEQYNVFLIVYNTEKIDYSYGGELVSLNIKASNNYLGKIFNFIKRIYKIRNLKKKYAIDTTISLLSSPNLLNIFTKKNDKVIVSVRNYISKSSNGLLGIIGNILVRKFYNRADSVISVSKILQLDLIENFNIDKEKASVIYNPYDIKLIKKLAAEPIEEEYLEIFENPVIVTVGSLSNQKGQWHLIRAFAKIKKDVKNAKLVILGKGPLEAYLKQLAKDLQMEEDVTFLGFQKNPFKYIAKSKLYVFPSLYEGFPNALCEAMACAIPVISADCKSGPREILAPKTKIEKITDEIEYAEYGVLVPLNDGVKYIKEDLTKEEEFLSSAMLSLIKDEKLYEKYRLQSINGVERFTINKIIKLWEKEIRD